MDSENAPHIEKTESGNERIRSAAVSTIDGRASTGQFVIRQLNTGDRVKAGLGWLGVSWLIAIVCIALPVIHFVLVPLFLLLGPVGFLYGYRSSERIESGTGSCPACSAAIAFPRGRYLSSYKDTCPKCLHALYIQF